jgi:hypothetical protein
MVIVFMIFELTCVIMKVFFFMMLVSLVMVMMVVMV